MSSCARSQPSRPGQLYALVEVGQDEPRCRRAGQDWIAERELSKAPVERGALLTRVARRERFGRFGSREEIRVEARRQQEISAIVAVLDLDPDRLNRPLCERHAVHGGALLGRQNRGRHPDAALGARYRPALVVGSCRGRRRRARGAADERTGDDRGCEPSPHHAVHIERLTQANRRQVFWFVVEGLTRERETSRLDTCLILASP